MGDLIDTTEMYLKTILEMEEDGVTPLRARIVERLGHSGPTVSQTVARMERDGFLHVMGDRRLELTERGRAVAVEVLRKHRLAERLLLDIIGVNWVNIHEEACRWEHVMSDEVEEHLSSLLNAPSTDPFGNSIPQVQSEKRGDSVELTVRNQEREPMRVVRIGEPIQAEKELLVSFAQKGIVPGSTVSLEQAGENVIITSLSQDEEYEGESVVVPLSLAAHLFVERI